MGSDFPSGARPGAYQARLCVEPEVEQEGAYAVEVVCDGCAAPPTRDGTEASSRHCISIPLVVDARPWLTWWRLVAILLAAALATYLVVRWKLRLRFPSNIWVNDKIDLRAESERRGGVVRHAMTTWKRWSAGPDFYLVRTGEHDATLGISPAPGTVCLGIRSLGRGRALIWRHRSRTISEDSGSASGTWRVLVGGTPSKDLKPMDKPPPLGRQTRLSRALGWVTGHAFSRIPGLQVPLGASGVEIRNGDTVLFTIKRP